MTPTSYLDASWRDRASATHLAEALRDYLSEAA